MKTFTNELIDCARFNRESLLHTQVLSPEIIELVLNQEPVKPMNPIGFVPNSVKPIEKPIVGRPLSKIKKYVKQILNFEQYSGLNALKQGTRVIQNTNVITKLANKGFADYNNHMWTITDKGINYLENSLPI